MTILKMTLEQAIQHAKNQADALAGTPCGEQHAQLSGWLTELLAVREAQSAGWTNNNKADAALVMLDRIETTGFVDDDRIDEVKRIIRQIAAPPEFPANVIGRPATPGDSPYPATISGGCLLAQAWADGYNVRNAVTAAPAPAVPAAIEPTYEAIKAILPTANPDEYACCVGADMWNACRAAMLQPQTEPQNIPNNIPTGCKWTYDEHDYKWDSACGEAWQFTDGGPEDNGVKFCQGCGKTVVLAAPTPTK